MGPLALSLYHYQGLQTASNGGVDNFVRTGYGAVYNAFGRWSSETVLQNGWDSNCGSATRAGCASSGGFTQLRYAFDRRLFAEGRYEGTFDSMTGMSRDAVFLLGYAIAENVRATIEDVVTNAPQPTHTTNVQATVAL
jgi:hypothetical protein